MEKDIASSAEQDLNFFTGTAGVAINSFTTVDTAGAKLLEQGVNIASDAYMAMTVRDGSSLKGALLNNFTPVFNEDIVRSSAIGHLSYFDIFQSQNIKRHTAGAGPRCPTGSDRRTPGVRHLAGAHRWCGSRGRR